MTTIITKNSSTSGAAPTAGDLVQGELAVNVTDKALYTENASGTVIKLNAPSIVDNGNATAITIDSSENVGIGTSSPGSNLEINGKSSGGSLTFNSTTTGTTNTITSVLNNGNAYSNINYVALNHIFKYGATEAMRIDTSGNLLVGTTSTVNNGILSVYNQGTGQAITGRVSNNSYSVFQGFNSTGSVVFQATGGGAVYISGLGTGTVYSNSGNLTNTNPSDERLKSDITDLSWGLNEILQLRPVSYSWKNNPTNQGMQYGFIAQEVQPVMPELVREFETQEDGENVTRFGLEKEGINAALVKAIQEQQAIITTLTERITALEQA